LAKGAKGRCGEWLVQYDVGNGHALDGLRMGYMRHLCEDVLWVVCAAALAACSPSMAAPVTQVAPATQVSPVASTPATEASPIPTAAAGEITDPFPGWLTYRDPATGYSIRYPPDAYLMAGHNAAGVYTARIQFHLPGVAGYQGMVVRVEPNPNRTGIERILPQLYQKTLEAASLDDLLTTAQAVTVGGVAGVRAGGSEGDFSIVVPYADRVYILAPVHDMTGVAADPATLDVFNRIVESFSVK
jgi:hypothetical protein